MRARRLAARQAAGPAATPAAAPERVRAFLPASAASAASGQPLLDALERAVADLDRLAADPAYTAEEQQAFVRAARPMRRQFAALAGAQFDAHTAGFAAAAAALGDVEAELAAAQGRIDNLPAIFELLTRAAAVVDNLVQTVAPV